MWLTVRSSCFISVNNMWFSNHHEICDSLSDVPVWGVLCLFTSGRQTEKQHGNPLYKTDVTLYMTYIMHIYVCVCVCFQWFFWCFLYLSYVKGSPFTTAFKKMSILMLRITAPGTMGEFDMRCILFWNKPINYLQASAEQRNLIYFYLPSLCLYPYDRETEQTQGTVREADRSAYFSPNESSLNNNSEEQSHKHTVIELLGFHCWNL